MQYSPNGALLGTFTADATSQLHILGHDGDSFGMNGTKVGVFKDPNQVGLSRFLQGKNCSRLKTEVILEILGDLSNQTLKGSLSNQKVSSLLILADLTESNRSWTKALRGS